MAEFRDEDDINEGKKEGPTKRDLGRSRVKQCRRAGRQKKTGRKRTRGGSEKNWTHPQKFPPPPPKKKSARISLKFVSGSKCLEKHAYSDFTNWLWGFAKLGFGVC